MEYLIGVIFLLILLNQMFLPFNKLGQWKRMDAMGKRNLRLLITNQRTEREREKESLQILRATVNIILTSNQTDLQQIKNYENQKLVGERKIHFIEDILERGPNYFDSNGDPKCGWDNF